jgi:hypothetical protein
VCAVVWVLDEAIAVVSEAVAAAVTAVVGGDVAVGTGGSGCERRGWEACWGAIALPGSECCRLRGAGSRFGAGEGMVVVVVDDTDGGCAAVINGDVADGSGGDGWVGVSSRGVVCVRESTVEVEVVWVPSSIVTLAVDSVCTSASIPTFWSCVCCSSHLSGPCLISQLSRSAALPRSSPSFSPFSCPSRLPSSSIAVLAFLIVL